MITIFDLALGLSRQVSHSLLARGLQLSFTLIPSRPTALEFYCQCSFDLFDCVTIKSLNFRVRVFVKNAVRYKRVSIDLNVFTVY